MLNSCHLASSIGAYSVDVSQLNACSGDDDDLQAEQTAQGNHVALHIMVVYINFYMFVSLVNSLRELINQ